MARLIGPDEASRTVYTIAGGALRSAAGLIATIYADEAATTPANILTQPGGSTISGGQVTVDAYSRLPLIQFPDGVDTVYAVINSGPVVPLYARTDDRLDTVTAAASAAVQRSNHTGTQPANTITGLGGAATLNVGTTAGTVAAGDDARITGAAADAAVLHLANTEAITGDKAVRVNELRTFHQALANRHYAPCRVALIGASTGEGVGVTAYGRHYFNRLRDLLRARFPVAGVAGGENYVGAWGAPAEGALPAYTWPVARSVGTGNDNSTGWALKATALSGATQSLTYTFTGTSVQVWYSQYGGGGNFTVAIDGGAASPVNSSGSTDRNAKWVSGALSVGSHTIVVEWASGNPNPAYIHGFAAFNGDESAGIHFYNGAQASKTTTDFVSNSAEWAPRLATIQPHLVLIPLGINDFSSSIPSATTLSNLQSIIATVRSNTTTNPSIVVVKSTRVTAGTFAEPFANYQAAWQAVASQDTGGYAGSSGVALLDLAVRQVSPVTDNTFGLFNSDLTHYTDMGASLTAESMAAFLSPR